MFEQKAASASVKEEDLDKLNIKISAPVDDSKKHFLGALQRQKGFKTLDKFGVKSFEMSAKGLVS